MATPWELIHGIGAAGLTAEDVDDVVRYLTTFQLSPRSERAAQTINTLSRAGLDSGGVNQVVNYLRTGQIGADVARPAPQASLAVSPAWLAFRRSLGIADTTDAATTQAQIDALNRRAGLTRGDLLEQGQQALQNTANSYEARGLFRSGARLQSQAQQQAGQARTLADIESQLAEQTAGLTSSLAQRQAERQRAAAEGGLSTAYDEATRGGYG